MHIPQVTSLLRHQPQFGMAARIVLSGDNLDEEKEQLLQRYKAWETEKGFTPPYSGPMTEWRPTRPRIDQRRYEVKPKRYVIYGRYHHLLYLAFDRAFKAELQRKIQRPDEAKQTGWRVGDAIRRTWAGPTDGHGGIWRRTIGRLPTKDGVQDYLTRLEIRFEELLDQHSGNDKMFELAKQHTRGGTINFDSLFELPRVAETAT